MQAYAVGAALLRIEYAGSARVRFGVRPALVVSISFLAQFFPVMVMYSRLEDSSTDEPRTLCYFPHQAFDMQLGRGGIRIPYFQQAKTIAFSFLNVGSSSIL